MVVLTFAHKGEAQEFLRRKHNIPVDFHFSGVYRHENELLLLTGAGIENAAIRLKSILDYFGRKIQLVINLGIGGSLHERWEINQIYGIKKTLRENNPYGEIYQTRNKRTNIVCVSAERPVITDDHALKLARFADVVDLELWGCAHVSRQYGIELKAYKLISDRAGSRTNKAAVKQDAAIYASHLFDFYKKLSF